MNFIIFSVFPLPWQRHENLSVLSEVSRQPRGAEWLWHPKVVGLYKLVLQSSDSNSTGREAAVGALQNITAGESRVGTSATKTHIPDPTLKAATGIKAWGLGGIFGPSGHQF